MKPTSTGKADYNEPTNSGEGWRERWKKERTDAISEMFDNVKNGIYPTTKFFERIDKAFESSRTDVLQEMIKLSDDTELRMNTHFDEWRAFKHFRNTVRTLLANPKEE